MLAALCRHETGTACGSEGVRDRQVQNAVLQSTMMGLGLFSLDHV